MDYFGPGVRELRHLSARLKHRLRLMWVQRQLAAAETELGLLGWQQADFDAETQNQVDKIHHVEREQSRLTNAGAELAGEIHSLVEKRDAAQRGAQAQRQQLDAERARLREPLNALAQQLAALRRTEHDYERRVPELDREQREVDALYSKLLLVQPQPPHVRDELLRLRDRLIAIPNEKTDLRSQHLRGAAELQAREKEAAAFEAQIADIDRRLGELDLAARADEAKVGAELRDKEREKARLSAEIDQLERGKANPYREIGRVLADSNLPPLNQPHVLQKVKDLRFAAQAHEYEIAASEHASSQEDRFTIQISFGLWAILFVALALLLAVLF